MCLPRKQSNIEQARGVYRSTALCRAFLSNVLCKGVKCQNVPQRMVESDSRYLPHVLCAWGYFNVCPDF